MREKEFKTEDNFPVGSCQEKWCKMGEVNKYFKVGEKVKESREAITQGINIPVDAIIKYPNSLTEELVTIEFTRKSGKRGSTRIHPYFLEKKPKRERVKNAKP